jgi:ribonuclease HI
VKVELWTDGSGIATGGPGGYAYVLRALDDEGNVLRQVEGADGLNWATNQRAELCAVIAGLLTLTRPTTLTIFTDSEYVMHGFTKGWVDRWEANGWINREGEDVANRDLWEVLAAGVRGHDVTWEHVKGHKSIKRCEACDTERPNRLRKCPECEAALVRIDVYPLNARCDELAGAERKKIIEAAQAA